MKRYLLDTNAAGQFIEKNPKFIDRAREVGLAGSRVGICVPVLAELHYGFELSESREHNLEKLAKALERLRIWPFDHDAAVEFGRIRADLRRRGRPISVIDVMIASIAFTLGDCAVVTTDSDFDAIPDLVVEDWTK